MEAGSLNGLAQGRNSPRPAPLRAALPSVVDNLIARPVSGGSKWERGPPVSGASSCARDAACRASPERCSHLPVDGHERPLQRGAAPAVGAMDRVVSAIDGVSTAAGWLAGWLIVPMTFAVAYEVAARHVFNAPTKWTYEVGYMTYGAQFMLAAAYTLLKGGTSAPTCSTSAGRRGHGARSMRSPTCSSSSPAWRSSCTQEPSRRGSPGRSASVRPSGSGACRGRCIRSRP